MDFSHDIIFLTDKTGKKKDKTNQISYIQFDSNKNQYLISFENDDRVFHYKPENVEIIHNTISEKKPKTILDYFKDIASLSNIKNDAGENILVKNYNKLAFIHSDSALSLYLNPKDSKIRKYESSHPIFPFGCNNSQFQAVTNALENSFSIIQGPPGTGKTQTILNIIANLFLLNKTTLVVSNNNSAIENIYEKLSLPKYNLSFIVAPLGKSDNIADFIKEQDGEYPPEISDWTINQDEKNVYDTISKSFEMLKTLFVYQEQESQLKHELDQLEIEYKHFSLISEAPPLADIEKLYKTSSKEIMELWQKLQVQIDRKGLLSFFFKCELFFKYHIGTWRFWKIQVNYLLNLLKHAFYKNRITELQKEITEKEKFKNTFNPENSYASALAYFRHKIYKHYCKNEKRKIFSEKELNTTESGFYSEYPVVLSTTFSSRNCLPYFSPDFLFDYLIMDEASQVDVATGALALSCAKNVVIVGDKMQLPNVVTTLDKKRAQSILSQYQIDSAYDFSSHSFLSSLEELLPNIPKVLLREHYRCHPKIIDFCNKKFYNNQLLIMTKDENEKNVLRVFKTNKGNHCRGHENQRQLDVIKENILPLLTKTDKKQIGIIAPYRDQTNLISQSITDIQADTVHKFQGREKDIIIISTTDDKISDFSDDPNLLNVAISRAKTNLFIVISGNEQPTNRNITDLIEYIRYNNFEITESKVNSVFDYLYEQYAKARFTYLAETNRISKYDSENLMYKLLTAILKNEKYSNFGIIFEQPLREIINYSKIDSLSEKEKKYAFNDFTHIDFLLYNKLTKQPVLAIEVDGYKYHKKGTIQEKRDSLKNHILKLFGIPLIRFSTTGSGEAETIIKTLDSIIAISEPKPTIQYTFLGYPI